MARSILSDSGFEAEPLGCFWDFNEKDTTETRDALDAESLVALGFPGSSESFLKLEEVFRGFKIVRSILSDSGEMISRGRLQAVFETSTENI